MNISESDLTPQQRQALTERPGEPYYIRDAETNKVYLMIEQGVVPSLDEEYVRDGLALARQQIAEGNVSSRSINDVIEEARRRHSHD